MYYKIFSRSAIFVFLACATVALLAAQAVFIGLSVRAAAGDARANARAEGLSLRIAELESHISIKDTVTPVEAEARGFGTPASLSYATKRSLGSAARFGNEL
ncbi:MAG: hypothetical protein G01um101417_631 [Parcubacteria group bacterium Gr01-1014_17]|nr:MAG: hypothetical protein G01um101417_631 [Parcubacteria group bacterium Gr01-1014_17]